MSDLRYAVRLLCRNPGFTAAAVLTLALGIGANTAVFSLLHRILIAALPVHDPERLVVLTRSHVERAGTAAFPHRFFRELEKERDVLEGVLCRGGSERVSVVTDAGAEPAVGELVSGSYFEVLGLEPHLGRLFTRQDDVTPGAHPVVVVSHGYWQRRFGSDPGIVGRTIRLSGYPMTVIGVSPPGFFGLDPGQKVDLRVPLAMQAALRRAPSTLDQPGVAELQIVGRLRPGVGLEQARQVIGARWASDLETAPTRERQARASERIFLRPAASGVGSTRRQFETALWVLMAITVAVLLVACLNVANLMLATWLTREHELSIRAAIGAAPWRLVRQLLVESLLLSTCGATLGVLFAYAGSALLVKLAAGGAAAWDFEMSPAAPVLAFHVGLSTLAGILVGLGPAWRQRGGSLAPSLKAAPGRGSRLAGRKALVVLQVALSVAVLVGAALFLRTVHALRAVDPGFRSERLLLVWLDPKSAGRTDAETRVFFRAVRQQVQALPGVEAVTFSTVRAMTNSVWTGRLAKDGIASVEAAPQASRNAVGPDYFRTLGTPMRQGRDFTEGDDADAPRVAIVNETLARRYFVGQDPLGRKIGAERPEYTIVGVAQDARHAHLREAPAPFWYVPYEQRPTAKLSLDLVVRTAGEPERMASAVRFAIASVDGAVAPFEMRSQAAQIDDQLKVESMLAVLASAFGVTAALLAALGLYGVLSVLVSQRRREIGIRMALGAPPGAVARRVAGEATLQVGAGILTGVAVAAGASRFVEAILYGVRPLDVATLAGASTLMTLIAMFAIWLPARRAARVDPMAALREP